MTGWVSMQEMLHFASFKLPIVNDSYFSCCWIVSVKLLWSRANPLTASLGSQKRQYTLPELFAEVAVNKGVDRGVSCSKPLGDRFHDTNYLLLIPGKLRPKHNTQVQAVHGQPGQAKESGHRNEHAHYTYLRTLNIALCLGTADSGNIPPPNLHADERVADTNKWQRH